ncbi:MAG: hypothetical protein NXI20_23085 [bacterium]|nr:hypothetical protein [bacterium]
MNKLSTIFSILLISLISGCDTLLGEEIARIPVNQVSYSDDNLQVQKISLDLKKEDKILIWSDMDIEYEDYVELGFRVNVLKDGEQLGGFEFDPTEKNITVGEIKTTVMGKTDWKFSGKNTFMTIEEDGNYTFEAILVASENPTLIVNKAEIVLKK